MASKISRKEWTILFVVTGTIDVIQIVIDFTGVGVAINEVADPIIGGILAGYLSFRGVSMITHWKRLASIVGGTVAEMALVSVLPAWILDVWYIHYDVKKEEAEIKAIAEQQEMLANVTQMPLYGEGENGEGVREPVRQEAVANGTEQEGEEDNVIRVNFQGVRPPNKRRYSERPVPMNTQTEEEGDDSEIPMQKAA